jgi:hypothetical protein
LTDLFREDGFLYDEKFNYSSKRYDLLDYLEIDAMNALPGVGKLVLRPQFGNGYWYPFSAGIFLLIGGQFTFFETTEINMLEGKGTFLWNGPETFGEYYGQKEPVPVSVEEISFGLVPCGLFNDGTIAYFFDVQATPSLFKYDNGRLTVVKRGVTESPGTAPRLSHPAGFHNGVAFFAGSGDNIFSMPNLQSGDPTPVAVMDETAVQAFGNLIQGLDGLYVFDYYDVADDITNVWKIVNSSTANYLGWVESTIIENGLMFFHPYLKRIYKYSSIWGYSDLTDTGIALPYHALSDAGIADFVNITAKFAVNKRDNKIYFQRIVAAPSTVKGVTVYDPITNVATNLTAQGALDTDERGYLDDTTIFIWNDQLFGLNDDEILRFLQPRGSKLNMAPSVCFARKHAPGIDADDFWQNTQMFKTKIEFMPYSNQLRDFLLSFGTGDIDRSAYEADNGRHFGFRIESDASDPKVYATFKNENFTLKRLLSNTIVSGQKYKFEVDYLPEQKRVAWYIDDSLVTSLDNYVMGGAATFNEMNMFTHGLKVWGNMDGIEIHEVKYYIDS